MLRRDFVKTAAMFTFAGSMQKLWAESHSSNGSVRPNIIVILVDDLGYGDLSCYGGSDLRTPCVDSMMDAGMRWDNFYSNSPVCSPTRAALLSGCYPDRVGVPGVIRTDRSKSWGCLSSEAVLLSEVLKKAGYDTAAIGKWHLGIREQDLPNRRGFDYFHGFLGDMMDDYFTHIRDNINYMRRDSETIDPEGHATDLFTQWSVDYIKEQAKKDKPFFLYLAYNAPHTPIQPRGDWLERVKEREPQIDGERAMLVALIEHMDDGIGQVVAAVNSCGISEHTLMVFVSDNGGQLGIGANNGKLNGGKGTMYEGGIKVPMCAVWPGTIKAGSRNCDEVALTMDIFPTACEAAGVKVPGDIDGMSFLQSLKGSNSTIPDKRYLFWVRREGGEPYGGQEYYAVRYGDWKLLQNTPFERFRLYNLREDPGEVKALPESHEMYQTLFGVLQNHVNDIGRVPWQRK